MVRDEQSRERNPHVTRCAESVQQHDRRALTTNPRVDCYAIGFDFAYRETGWKRHRTGTEFAEVHFGLLI
jgi:hypothetical protein